MTRAVGEATLAFVDLEMTGLDVASDRIVEVAVLRHVGRARVDEVVSLVHPERDGGAGASVHGIPASELEAAPPFAALAPRVAAALQGAVVVGHGVEMDLDFLAMELARAGVPFDRPEHLDTLVLSRRCLGLSRSRLEDVAAHLGVPHVDAHRAKSDAETTAEVFFALASMLEARTIEDLEAVRIGEGVARPDVVAALREAVRAGGPVALRYRPARRGPLELVMVLRALREDETPPRVVGYDVATRSRRELRADRVLAVRAVERPVEP